jgi:hypothetical protein
MNFFYFSQFQMSHLGRAMTCPYIEFLNSVQGIAQPAKNCPSKLKYSANALPNLGISGIYMPAIV